MAGACGGDGPDICAELRRVSWPTQRAGGFVSLRQPASATVPGEAADGVVRGEG